MYSRTGLCVLAPDWADSVITSPVGSLGTEDRDEFRPARARWTRSGSHHPGLGGGGKSDDHHHNQKTCRRNRKGQQRLILGESD
jgi:hypothetical protein